LCGFKCEGIVKKKRRGGKWWRKCLHILDLGCESPLSVNEKAAAKYVKKAERFACVWARNILHSTGFKIFKNTER